MYRCGRRRQWAAERGVGGGVINENKRMVEQGDCVGVIEDSDVELVPSRGWSDATLQWWTAPMRIIVYCIVVVCWPRTPTNQQTTWPPRPSWHTLLHAFFASPRRPSYYYYLLWQFGSKRGFNSGSRGAMWLWDAWALVDPRRLLPPLCLVCSSNKRWPSAKSHLYCRHARASGNPTPRGVFCPQAFTVDEATIKGGVSST